MTVDGERVFDGRAWQVIVALTGAFGGGAEVDADPADGELDLVVIEAESRVRLVRHGYGLRAGEVEGQPGVITAAGKRIEVETDPESGFNVDGELLHEARALVRRRAERLRGGHPMSRLDPRGLVLTPPKLVRPEPGWRRAVRKYWPLGVAGGTALGWYAADSLRHRREGAFGYEIGTELEVDSPEFLRAAEALTGAPITTGNDAELLINGDRIFPVVPRDPGLGRANAQRCRPTSTGAARSPTRWPRRSAPRPARGCAAM